MKGGYSKHLSYSHQPPRICTEQLLVESRDHHKIKEKAKQHYIADCIAIEHQLTSSISASEAGSLILL